MTEFDVRNLKGSNHRTIPDSDQTRIEPCDQPKSLKALAHRVISQSSISNQSLNSHRTQGFDPPNFDPQDSPQKFEDNRDSTSLSKPPAATGSRSQLIAGVAQQAEGTGPAGDLSKAGYAGAPDLPHVADVLDRTEHETLNLQHPINNRRIPVVYLTDPNTAKPQLKAMAESGNILAVDTETCPKPEFKADRKAGLSPATGQLRLVQVTDGEKALVLDMVHIPADILGLLSTARIVFHNAPFDLSFLLAASVRLDEVSCTQLMIAALTHQPMISLADACKTYLGVRVNKELQTSDWTSPELVLEQIEYAAKDALLTLALYEKLLEKLKSNRLMAGFQRVERCLPAIVDAKAHGILLDTKAHRALVVQWQKDKEAAKAQLQTICCREINLNSGQQLSAWLRENLDQDICASWPKTRTSQLRTDKDTLEQFSHVALVQPLLEYRRVSLRLANWGETYQRHLSADHRLHPNFVLLGARSGRMSCNNPNVQNLPRDPKLRACFIAPPGYKLMAADFAQIELRIAGLLSGDPAMRSAYEHDRDLHRAIVAQVTNRSERDITVEERKLGKAINFGLLYGASAHTFQTRARVDYGLDLSLEKAERFKSVFDQTYSRLRYWQQARHQEAQTTGMIRTVGGRLVSFQNPAKCYTEARNYSIQAAAADLQMLAIQRVHDALRQKDLPAYLVNFIHDELVLEVREDAVADVHELLRQEMTEAFLDLFKSYQPESMARGLVEVNDGQNYAEAK